MYTDVAEITPQTYDRKSGAKTTGEAFEVMARIEAQPTVSDGTSGSEEEYGGLYILPPSTNVNNGYLIRPIKINGEDIVAKTTKVKNVFRLGDGVPHHLEVDT